MKELTIEEKAKQYDEAIKIAKSNYDTIAGMDENCTFARSGIINTFHHMFPELKESEEERIIHWIREELESKYVTDNIVNNVMADKALAWLEKQGEKIEPIDGFNTEFEKQVSYLVASVINREYEYTEAFVKWAANGLLVYAKHEIEKQDTKISVYKDTLFKIATILSQYEDKEDSPLEKIRSIMIDGTICSMDIESKKKERNKQKLTDAEMKILLQTEYEKGKADAIEAAMKSVTTDKESAIKFLKSAGIMNDNGKLSKEYVADDVEQNSTWSDNDERMCNTSIRACQYMVEHFENSTKVYEDAIDWLKSSKERYTWKPSAEQIHYLSWVANIKLGNGVVEQEVSKHLNELCEDLKKLRK